MVLRTADPAATVSLRAWSRRRRDGTVDIFLAHAGRIVRARPGDLLVSYRLSPYQWINDVNGDPGTHVAVLAVVGRAVVTIEMGPDGVFSRAAGQFASRYLVVTVVRLDADEAARERLVAAGLDRLADDAQAYSHAQCFGVGGYALARRVLPSVLEPFVTAVALTFAAVAYVVHGGRRVTCSGFVAQLLCEAGLAPRLAMPSRRPVRWRDRGRLEVMRRVHRRVLSERWRGPWTVLVSPSDIVATANVVSMTAMRGSSVVHRPVDRVR